MSFDCVEDFEEFYKKYTLANGFKSRRRSSMDGYLRWVCRKAGYNSVKQKQPDATGKIKRKSASVRVGCEHKISLKLDPNCGKWFILSFTATHNHGVVTPNKAHFVPKGVTIEESGQHVIEMFKDHGIPVGKVATLFGKGRFTKRNCYNHLRDVRTKILDVGDAQGVLEYCEEQTALDPRFFYRIQIDEEGRMSNFFWIDARSRLAYQLFGDAIVFDTTYRTNRYAMPLAPFTGVDNHKRSILFGCALLMDELDETFVWLFRTWLEAMEGKEPVSIITDQDKAIAKAIREVLPSVRHRFCILHIQKKFSSKLPPIYNKSKEFKREIQDIIQNSLSRTHFDEQWLQCMVKYDLQEHKWLKKLFQISEMWVPVYTVDTFFAGMQASQRAESMNSLFSSKVNGGTSLIEFIRQYEIVLEDRYEEMRHEDYESRHKNRCCDRNSFLEEHAAEVYYRKMYLEFYHQLSEVERYKFIKVNDYVGRGEQFIVRHVTNQMEFYIVDLDMQSVEEGIVNSVTCSCGYFAWNGILCRHILKIFTCNNVVRIPDHYILHRWCKEASRPLDVFTSLNDEEKGQVVERVLSLNYLAAKVASMACKDHGTYDLVVSMYHDVIQKIENLFIGKPDIIEGEVGEASGGASNPIGHVPENQNNERICQVLMNPNISQTKGRKKEKKRLKSSLEVASSGQRRCGICKIRGHNAATCKKRKADDISLTDTEDENERRAQVI